jgi:hypothetical protein
MLDGNLASRLRLTPQVNRTHGAFAEFFSPPRTHRISANGGALASLSPIKIKVFPRFASSPTI